MNLTPAVIGVVVADMSASLAFYRLLGLEIPAEADGEPHVEVGPAHAVACHHHDEARALAASRSDAVVGPA